MAKIDGCCVGIIVVVVIIGLVTSFVSGDKDKTADFKDELQPLVDQKLGNSYDTVTIEKVIYKSFNSYVATAGWGSVLEVTINATKGNQTDTWEYTFFKKDANTDWEITMRKKYLSK